jgi:protein-L-isoaspartate(D-aspartate) O-methyltransferase
MPVDPELKMNLNRLLPLALLVLHLAGCASGTSSQPAATQSGGPVPPALIASPDTYLPLRLAMVEETIVDRGVTNVEVLRAVRTVPRHRFVPQKYLESAYADHPLPIGYGQTISQPFIVAWMTELLDLQPGDRVLEIGTGSGYQAAVLAELDEVEVYTIEIVPELAESAAQRLKDLGYTDVHARQGDGYYGWAEAAPFDAIIVTAAPDHLPAPLVAQLAEGGSIVIPIGPPGGFQSLWRFVQEQGELVAYNMGGVAFVPFIGAGIEQVGQTPLP